jgi:hypothetical protein
MRHLLKALMLCLAACGPAAGGGTGGGSAGSGGSGGSGGGAAVDNPMPCTAGGAMSAPASITGRGLTLDYGTTSLVAPGSDLTGSLTTGSQIRLGLKPAAMNDPPHTELSLFFNGCSVGKLMDPGEEYFWTTRPGDPAISIEPGRHLVVEVVRAGQGVILRRSFALPSVLPKLTAPAPRAALSAPPTQLTWDPLTLPAGSKLSVTAWRSLGGGAGGTDGHLLLTDPSAGQATWNDGRSRWTSLALTAELKPETNVTFYLTHFVPVN